MLYIFVAYVGGGGGGGGGDVWVGADSMTLLKVIQLAHQMDTEKTMHVLL